MADWVSIQRRFLVTPCAKNFSLRLQAKWLGMFFSLLWQRICAGPGWRWTGNILVLRCDQNTCSGKALFMIWDDMCWDILVRGRWKDGAEGRFLASFPVIFLSVSSCFHLSVSREIYQGETLLWSFLIWGEKMKDPLTSSPPWMMILTNKHIVFCQKPHLLRITRMVLLCVCGTQPLLKNYIKWLISFN